MTDPRTFDFEEKEAKENINNYLVSKT